MCVNWCEVYPKLLSGPPTSSYSRRYSPLARRGANNTPNFFREPHGGVAEARLASALPQPRAMPSTRLSLRLGQLPHAVLADLAAQLCSESPALQAAAEECMAAHKPLPHEMVERVLLSPDLVPAILGPLAAEDGAAAAVCSQWLAGWNATNEPRRRLKQVPLDLPEELVTDDMGMAATPDGRLVVCDGSELRILDRSMRVLQTMACENCGLIATSDESIFHTVYGGLDRFSHDGTPAAEYQLEGWRFYGPVLAPGGLLFCVIYPDDGGPEQEEIIALDAQTLQLRHRFGLGLLNNAMQLAVAGDELIACDAGNHRLQVFSLTGEHRRSITGEWKSPVALCFAKDRLYLAERPHSASPLQGSRLLVLSLQGDLLQVVTHPTEPTAVFSSICCFGRKLLASYRCREPAGAPWKRGVLALHGL